MGYNNRARHEDSMHMWPLPEPKEEPIPPPPDDVGILNLDDLLGPEKEVKGKGEICT
jgi:hypothetical protein